jgi:phosphate uptake regulator
MKRKLVRQGAATLMVSVPAKWARQFNLGKGSEVEVSEEDNAIIITSERSETRKTKEVNVKQGAFLKRMIFMPYREGYDTIRLNFDDPKIMGQIENVVDMLMGFEIIDQGPTHCRIGTVSVESEQSFENVLRRCFLLIKTMAEESHDALQKKEFEKMRSIGDMERSVHRYCDFTMRIINKTWTRPKPEITRTYWVITILKEISDLLAETCNYMHEKKPKLSKDIVSIYRRTVDLASRLSDIYYKPRTENLLVFKKNTNSTIEKGRKMLSGKESEVVHNLLGIAERARRAQELLM